ncbi:hypothetical protein GCM10010402_63990 [Actinomadura luteofluorescens]|uniref:DUF397 domain-containing protein n=1 Tax=Actinomadura luteofluorescens TaxID=46163 RepID=UPI0021644E9B|nr:DUF397 domain-containing protein [Actinomadura glauciflava]MCR3741791.1 protein of unknown function (DUF397) [Actinomadura glauciflava]
MDLSKLAWRKSSRSNESGDNCIEIAGIAGAVAIRDSKDPDGPKLVIGHGDFWRFAAALKKL